MQTPPTIYPSTKLNKRRIRINITQKNNRYVLEASEQIIRVSKKGVNAGYSYRVQKEGTKFQITL